MEQKNTSAMEALIEAYLDRTQKDDTELTKEDIEAISGIIKDKQELADGLRVLKNAVDTCNESAKKADEMIKNYQTTKKFWNRRVAGLMSVMEKVLRNLAIPGNQIKADNIKLSTSSRTSIEVDEDWLLGMSQPLADSLQAALPPYVKVTLSLDKNALNAFLKQDNTLMVDNPEKIHSKTSTSTTIK